MLNLNTECAYRIYDYARYLVTFLGQSILHAIVGFMIWSNIARKFYYILTQFMYASTWIHVYFKFKTHHHLQKTLNSDVWFMILNYISMSV